MQHRAAQFNKGLNRIPPRSMRLSPLLFVLTTDKDDGSTSNSNLGNSAMPEDFGGWGDYFAEIGFYKRFPAGPRKEATFKTEFTDGDGNTVDYTQLTTKHPYYGKFWLPGDVYEVYSSIPQVMMRYTNVLLIYAEAKARSGSPDKDAYDYLNKVRVRGRGTGTEIAVGSLSSSDFADSVVMERAWEFAGEAVRWFDLVRLEKVKEANSHKAPDDMKPAHTITKDDYLFPLPLSETNVNPNLK